MIFPKLHKPGGTPNAIPVKGHIPGISDGAPSPSQFCFCSSSTHAGHVMETDGAEAQSNRGVHVCLESSSAENQRATHSSPPWKIFQRHWKTSSDH